MLWTAVGQLPDNPPPHPETPCVTRWSHTEVQSYPLQGPSSTFIQTFLIPETYGNDVCTDILPQPVHPDPQGVWSSQYSRSNHSGSSSTSIQTFIIPETYGNDVCTDIPPQAVHPDPQGVWTSQYSGSNYSGSNLEW